MFRDAYKGEGSRWFRRLLKDCERISPHIKVKRIKNGFFRVFWRGAYIHEIYKELPQFGHDVYENDQRMVIKKYAEEKEDRGDLTRKIKNYKEGYWDSLDRIQTRVYLMRHSGEFFKTATDGYSKMNIK